MAFVVDKRIESSSIWLKDWSLSSLYLKNDANFPWIILIPRKNNIQEIHQLELAERQILIEEIANVSKVVENYFRPDKINVGALGNIVSQLHIHIIARFKEDKAWPHSVWQAGLVPTIYTEEALSTLILVLRECL